MEQQDIRKLRVREVMHSHWPTLEPDDTVETAVKLFAENGVSGVPVVDRGEIVGIVTEGDLIFRDAEIKAPGFLDILGGIVPLGSWHEYREETLKSAAVNVEQVMTRDLITVSPDATLSEAATKMAEKRIKLLPVVEGGRLHGVIQRMDIMLVHLVKPER